jgi:hypothetical protein
VIAWHKDLVVEPHPPYEAGVQLGGFPHGETRFVLPFVVTLDLVGLQHVDHHIGMLVERDVSGDVIDE